MEECEKDNDWDFVNRYKNGVEFVYEIELDGISKQLPELNMAELARRIAVSPVMMRKYATGKSKASEKRLLEIQIWNKRDREGVVSDNIVIVIPNLRQFYLQITKALTIM